MSAGVAERVVYGASDWPAFVLALRPGDRAAVADLRVFGSRRKLVAAAEEVEARGATLAVVDGAEIDMPTLREVDRTLTRWRGESAIKSGKRAREMGKRGVAARRQRLAEARLGEDEAGRVWRDVERYGSAFDALRAMPGWTRTTAWRRFGPREKN